MVMTVQKKKFAAMESSSFHSIINQLPAKNKVTAFVITLFKANTSTVKFTGGLDLAYSRSAALPSGRITTSSIVSYFASTCMALPYS